MRATDLLLEVGEPDDRERGMLELHVIEYHMLHFMYIPSSRCLATVFCSCPLVSFFVDR